MVDSERCHLANVIAQAFAKWISDRRATWRMLLQKQLQTEQRPFQVRSHMIQKLGPISKICCLQVRYCSVVSESVVICQLTLKMAEETDFENRIISNFKGLVTSTLTLDRVLRHTVVHHSSTSTYIPNFIRIGKTFLDGHTYVWTDRLLDIIRSTLQSRVST